MQERIFAIGNASDVLCNVREHAREFLLTEGTDARYGARHLKRAVERLVVQPLSNLIASGQLQNGDRLVVDFDAMASRLVFFKECKEALAASAGNSAAA